MRIALFCETYLPMINGVVTHIKLLKELGVRMFNGEFWCDHPEDWMGFLKESNAFLRGKLDKAFDD